MFIRKTQKIDKKSNKSYFLYQLVESYRTERGPRQRILLNLGSELNLSDEERKLLANRIEELIKGIQPIIPYSDDIESLACHFSKKLTHKKSQVCDLNNTEEPDYETVDLNSLENLLPRTIGTEYICYETIRELEIDRKLFEFGFSSRQVETALGVIIGRHCTMWVCKLW